MRQVTVIIKTETDAFSEDPKDEVCRILVGILDSDITNKNLYDINGNVVGEIIVK